MQAGRGRAPRPPGSATGIHSAVGSEQSPTRAKGPCVLPLRGRTAHRAPASPATWSPAPRPRGSAPRRAPTLARAPPPPLGPLGPPWPGPRRWRRQRSVTAPLLSCLRSAPCQEGEALLHPGGRGGGLRRRPARGDPAGEARGGEAAGQGVGGERAAPPQRPPPPAPASTFCRARRDAGAPNPAVLPLVPTGDPQRSWGPAPQTACSSRANLAARPAPQPFSRRGDRARSCRRGCRTRSLPGARDTARPAPPHPLLRSSQLHRDPITAAAAPAASPIQRPPLSRCPPTYCGCRALSALQSAAPLTAVGPRPGSTAPGRSGSSCAGFPTRPDLLPQSTK